MKRGCLINTIGVAVLSGAVDSLQGVENYNALAPIISEDLRR